MSAVAEESLGAKLWRLWRDPAAWITTTDVFIILTALSLPWSTSLVAIFAVAALVTMAPFFDAKAFLQSLKRPVSILPVALFALALVGTLWSDAPWGARLYAVGPTAKLLMLPLLFYHFERSTRGTQVFTAFLASCVLLMAMSWIVAFYPSLSLKTCRPAARHFRQELYRPEPGIRAVRGGACLSRHRASARSKNSAGVVAWCHRAEPGRQHGVRDCFADGDGHHADHVGRLRADASEMENQRHHSMRRDSAGGVCLGGVAAVALDHRDLFRDYQLYREKNIPTSIGLRLEYWQKSLRLFAEAPVIGHGTGSTRGLFEQAAAGQVGAAADVVGNPHNQTLNVAVQWGAVGIVVLYAMWLSHLLLFRGEGLVAWIGLLTVVQNIFTSLFNSHIVRFPRRLDVRVGGRCCRRDGAEESVERNDSGTAGVRPDHDGWHAALGDGLSAASQRHNPSLPCDRSAT